MKEAGAIISFDITLARTQKSSKDGTKKIYDTIEAELNSMGIFKVDYPENTFVGVFQVTPGTVGPVLRKDGISVPRTPAEEAAAYVDLKAKLTAMFNAHGYKGPIFACAIDHGFYGDWMV